jgi:hypothetical protein
MCPIRRLPLSSLAPAEGQERERARERFSKALREALDAPAKDPQRLQTLAEAAAAPADWAGGLGDELASRLRHETEESRPNRLSRLRPDAVWLIRRLARLLAERSEPFAQKADGAMGWGAALLAQSGGFAAAKGLRAARPQDFEEKPGALPHAMEACARAASHPACLIETARQCGKTWPPARKSDSDEFWPLVLRESARAGNFLALWRWRHVFDLRAPLLGGPCALSEWVAAAGVEARALRWDKLQWPHIRGRDLAVEFWLQWGRFVADGFALPKVIEDGAHPKQNMALWAMARLERQSIRRDERERLARREESLAPPEALDALELSLLARGEADELLRARETVAAAARNGALPSWPPTPWPGLEERLWVANPPDWSGARLGSAHQEALRRAIGAGSIELAKSCAALLRELSGASWPLAVANARAPWPDLIRAREGDAPFEGAPLSMLSWCCALAARERAEGWAPQERAAEIAMRRLAQAREQGAQKLGESLAGWMSLTERLTREASSPTWSLDERSKAFDAAFDPRLWSEQGRSRFSSLHFAPERAEEIREACLAAWTLWESVEVAAALSSGSTSAPPRAERRTRAL